MYLEIGEKYQTKQPTYGLSISTDKATAHSNAIDYRGSVIAENSILTYCGIFNPLNDHCFNTLDGSLTYVIEDEEIIEKLVHMFE